MADLRRRSRRKPARTGEGPKLGLQREAPVCRACGIEFISFPIPDRGVPEIQQASDLARSIADGMASGRWY